MKRAEKMKELDRKIAALKPAYDKYQKLERELQAAKNSFDIGEFVRVVETCQRGCCTERDYEGKIKSIQPNGMYEVVNPKTGAVEDSHVYSGDMQRI